MASAWSRIAAMRCWVAIEGKGISSSLTIPREIFANAAPTALFNSCSFIDVNQYLKYFISTLFLSMIFIPNS